MFTTGVWKPRVRFSCDLFSGKFLKQDVTMAPGHAKSLARRPGTTKNLLRASKNTNSLPIGQLKIWISVAFKIQYLPSSFPELTSIHIGRLVGGIFFDF